MRLLLIFLLTLTAPSALAQREITAITLQHAAPEQLVALIKPYLSAESSVRPYQNKLILNATPEELAKTRQLLQQLDVAGRQLLVSVRTDGTATTRDRGVDIDTVIRSGDVTITNNENRSHHQGSGDTDTRTTIRTQNRNGTQAGNADQTVRATEGMPAYIAAGTSAPVQSYTTGPNGQRYYQQEYVSALTGFYATIWVNGNNVRISLDQGNDQFDGRTIATQQLRSDVSGPVGQWIPLGSIQQSTRRSSSDIGSRAQTSHSASTELYIKVDPLD